MRELAGGQQMRDVWPLPAIGGWEKSFGKHPTQKPLSLLVRILLASTREGQWVLDPFAGSCTTGVAARLLGRRFFGIDQSSEFLSTGRTTSPPGRTSRASTSRSVSSPATSPFPKTRSGPSGNTGSTTRRPSPRRATRRGRSSPATSCPCSTAASGAPERPHPRRYAPASAVFGGSCYNSAA